MTTAIMLDIETLSTAPNATVLSVGAVKFNPYTDDAPHSDMHWRLFIEEQQDLGRAVDESTLGFWAKQSPSVIEEAFGEQGRITVIDFMAQLNKYLSGSKSIWCHGPQFDMVILEDLFNDYNHHKSWHYYNVMDSRTLFNLMPVDPRKAIQQELHNALEDARYQAIGVQESIKHFMMKKR